MQGGASWEPTCYNEEYTIPDSMRLAPGETWTRDWSEAERERDAIAAEARNGIAAG